MDTSLSGGCCITFSSSCVCQTCASRPYCWNACGLRDASPLSLCHWSVTSLGWQWQFSSWSIHCRVGSYASSLGRLLVGVSGSPAVSWTADSWSSVSSVSSFSLSLKRRKELLPCGQWLVSPWHHQL